MSEQSPSLVHAASGLLDAYLKLGVDRAERAGKNGGVLAGAFVLFLLGLLAMLGAATLALTPLIGLAAALAIDGIVLGLLGGGALLRLSAMNRRDKERSAALRRRIHECEEEVKAAMTLGPSGEGEAGQTGENAGMAVLKRAGSFLLSNPQTSLAAAFAIASAIGPLRAIKFLTRLIGTAVTLRSVAKNVASHMEGGNAEPRAPRRERRRSEANHNGAHAPEPRTQAV